MTGPSVGPDCLIHPTAVIEGNVTIGARCVIKPNAIIGFDGYGYSLHDDGSWEHRPHSGGVVIGDDVHIGANTCIDQGTTEPTRIGDGTKIDNLCHIAHNVQIGKNVMVVALSMIAGSVVIGDGAYVAPASAVREHVVIGEGALVGLGAVVTKTVHPHTVVYGVPAEGKAGKGPYDRLTIRRHA